jgi:helicase
MKTNLSRKFLSDAILDFIVGSSLKSKKLPLTLVERVKQWNRVFFDCNCKANPFCIHPKMKLSKLLLDLRLSGLNISQMIYELTRSYDLFIYPGDLLSWLDEIIHAIQSVARLAKAMKNNEILVNSKHLALAIQSANPNYLDKGIKFFNKSETQNPKKRLRKASTKKRKRGIARKQVNNQKISRRK